MILSLDPKSDNDSSETKSARHRPAYPLRTAALLALPIAAAGSVALTLHAGARNSSRILVALFVGWVLSQFAGFAWAAMAAKRWGPHARTTLYVSALIVAPGSLAAYGYVWLGPSLAKPASVFLMAPLAAWLLLARTLLNTKR